MIKTLIALLAAAMLEGNAMAVEKKELTAAEIQESIVSNLPMYVSADLF